MPTEERDYSAFMERYQSLPVEELVRLHENASDLEDIARLALEHEVARRRVEIEKLRCNQAADRATDLEWDAKQSELRTQRELRESKRDKWYLAVLSPLAVLTFVLSPREPGESFFRAETIFLISVALWWVATIARWRSTAKTKKGVAGDA